MHPDDINGSGHLISQVDISIILQQVLDHPQISLATGSDEGCVSIVILLNVQLGWIFRQNGKELKNISIVR